MAKKSSEDNFEDMKIIQFTSKCDDSVTNKRRLDRMEAEIRQLNYVSTQQDDRLKKLAAKVDESFGIDTLANRLRVAGIYFDDSMLHFPHDFVQQFESYFAGMCVLEYHKCLAFLGVILTKHNEEWKRSVRWITEYEDLKKCFFRKYWDKAAQSRAVERCRQDFRRAHRGTEIVNTMLRWANSLYHCNGVEGGIDIPYILGDFAYRYWAPLREPGQSVVELRKKLMEMEEFVPDDPSNNSSCGLQ
ncbi:uncharacterized protein LOC135841220 [Planococcus citri]|uniref:uncharacterized protein LOC135841220 n=1 Tax=Planococcus citri TaxID=170843 RepID=UPI0031FA1DD2